MLIPSVADCSGMADVEIDSIDSIASGSGRAKGYEEVGLGQRAEAIVRGMGVCTVAPRSVPRWRNPNRSDALRVGGRKWGWPDFVTVNSALNILFPRIAALYSSGS
ncbi:hypothetical protein MVEN_00076500 [Mycena venus]|uniref:Uncharacterized protein n=1 Tax=Mycena venus TaxID=2733690 RepID=A0A8H7DE63_9AGAR|nr:hypothetical protein MVEN_00076500 [Mycena venus]